MKGSKPLALLEMFFDLWARPPHRLEFPAGEQRETTVVINEPCATVGDALAALGRLSPGVLDRVVDEQGHVRQHMNVFRSGENVRFLDGLRTPVSNGDAILILAAISGG